MNPAYSVTFESNSIILPAKCKRCDVLAALWFAIGISSLAVGLWRSFATGSEGDGFTAAAYMVAVGGLLLYPVQNCYFSRCRVARNQRGFGED